MKAFTKSKTVEPYQDGMDLRDYFAAKAMQGMCSNSINPEGNITGITQVAYQIADAMMEARK